MISLFVLSVAVLGIFSGASSGLIWFNSICLEGRAKVYQCQTVWCCPFSKTSVVLHNRDVFEPLGVNRSIVNLGTGYETLGISKAGLIQSQLDVEPTVTLHNLLFLVRKLISNKLVEAFDWLSCRKKRVFVGFCAGSRPKKRTKTWNKETCRVS